MRTVDAGHFGDRELVERRSGEDRRKLAGRRRRHVDRRISPGRGRAARSAMSRMLDTKPTFSSIDG
jgi:hypothetical protein